MNGVRAFILNLNSTGLNRHLIGRHVTGPTQNNDNRVPTIYQYPGTTLSFGIYLLARHVRLLKSKSFALTF